MADSLDLSRLLLFHSTLSLISSISYSPFYNLPISLYGLLVVEKKESEGGGDSVRQFSMILGLSFVMDIIWLLSSWRHETSTFAMLFIVMNFVLKPITFLAALGHLRQRGEPTFSLPGAFPSNFPGSETANNFLNGGGSGGGFPPRGQTMWQAPQSSYHQTSGNPSLEEDEDEEEFVAPQQQRQPPLRTGGAGPGLSKGGPIGAEGGGYHTLE